MRGFMRGFDNRKAQLSRKWKPDQISEPTPLGLKWVLLGTTWVSEKTISSVSAHISKQRARWIVVIYIKGVDINFKQVKISKTEAGELGGRYNKPMESLQVKLHKET